ncbi:NUDIX domain-containing protein [Bernardetia sp. OM2101]|uniref:NUDIX domain-containing protein n=1 Tax=Bernardetia sp. OM2101 TaxID=3344876 RepID=UPI0035CF220D
MDKSLEKLYGNKVRTRVCGICADDKGRLLVVNMKGISSDLEENQSFFAPVGGGIEFGEAATDALKREFLEETGLKIQIDYFMCVYEYVSLPNRIHAIELFFAVRAIGGILKTGFDPEHGTNQIITSVDYLDYSKILELPFQQRHGIFKYAASIENLKKLRGYIKVS